MTTLLYHLLLGLHLLKFGDTQHNIVYGRQTLWRLVPQSMRNWWLREAHTIAEHSEYTINCPEPMFEDKKLDLKQFLGDYNLEKLVRIIRIVDNKNMVMSNMVCPWKCSASCQNFGYVTVDVMIQRMLPKVELKFHSNADDYRKFFLSSNC